MLCAHNEKDNSVKAACVYLSLGKNHFTTVRDPYIGYDANKTEMPLFVIQTLYPGQTGLKLGMKNRELNFLPMFKSFQFLI